jgi:mono/diheme cytochrome c family protein
MHRSFFLPISALVLSILCVPAAVMADAAAGKAKYDMLCASCHGLTGAADGPVAQSLPEGSKPGNFQTGVFKFATDEAKFKELLRKGGAVVGLNALMPPQSGLTEAEMSDLYAYVMSLKK